MVFVIPYQGRRKTELRPGNITEITPNNKNDPFKDIPDALCLTHERIQGEAGEKVLPTQV